MILVLMAVLGLMIMPMLCILSFELARVFLAQQQLQNAGDAAVLTATAQLASSNNTNPTQAHTDAIAAALQVFQANYMLGQQLTNSTTVNSAGSLSASPGEANLYFTFIDPVTHNVVPISSPNGKIINLQACAGAYTVFGKFYGIPQFQVSSLSKGAVPILDIQICFDVSGSIDDQTLVTFVTRTWDNTHNKTAYNIATTYYGHAAEGTIFNVVQPTPTGTSLNATFPYCLEETSAYTFPGWYGDYLQFTWDNGSNLRSANGWPETGSPPGNYPASLGNTNFQPDPGTPYEFTDVVVNLDGNVHYGSYTTTSGYSFPTLGTLVEASRGNLDTHTAYVSSGASARGSLPASVTPKAGYQAAYYAAAATQLQPIAQSQAATLLFCDILNTDTDCHFGLSGFDEEVGTTVSPDIVTIAGNTYQQFTDNVNYNNVPPPYGASAPYPLPFIALNPALAQTNYNSVVSAVQSTVALGGTDIGGAIYQALNDLQTNGRTGSVKAILLFTDGEPTDPTGPGGFDPTFAFAKAKARAAAVAAGAAGIPVYTIGLAQIPAIESGEIAILNDTDPNPTSGGIAAISGHGATFNLVTDSSQLELTFEKIARRLVEIVANSRGDY
jgi:hypothetical protein